MVIIKEKDPILKNILILSVFLALLLSSVAIFPYTLISEKINTRSKAAGNTQNPIPTSSYNPTYFISPTPRVPNPSVYDPEITTSYPYPTSNFVWPSLGSPIPTQPGVYYPIAPPYNPTSYIPPTLQARYTPGQPNPTPTQYLPPTISYGNTSGQSNPTGQNPQPTVSQTIITGQINQTQPQINPTGESTEINPSVTDGKKIETGINLLSIWQNLLIKINELFTTILP